MVGLFSFHVPCDSCVDPKPREAKKCSVGGFLETVDVYRSSEGECDEKGDCKPIDFHLLILLCQTNPKRSGIGTTEISSLS